MFENYFGDIWELKLPRRRYDDLRGFGLKGEKQYPQIDHRLNTRVVFPDRPVEMSILRSTILVWLAEPTIWPGPERLIEEIDQGVPKLRYRTN